MTEAVIGVAGTGVDGGGVLGKGALGSITFQKNSTNSCHSSIRAMLSSSALGLTAVTVFAAFAAAQGGDQADFGKSFSFVSLYCSI